MAFGKSPAAQELSGRPESAQDTAKTEVSGRNGTWTQLRGTYVGRGVPSRLMLEWEVFVKALKMPECK